MSQQALTHERLSEPLVEPVSIDEAMLQCRADDEGEIRAAVAAVLCAARDHVENLLDGSLITRQMRAGYEYSPTGYRELLVPCPPLGEVERIFYVGGDGAEAVISPTNYRISRSSRQPSYIYFNQPVFAPRAGGVTPLYVEYTAGYGEAPESVPNALRQAVLLVCDDWFNNTALADSGSVSERVARTVRALIAPYRIAHV